MRARVQIKVMVIDRPTVRDRIRIAVSLREKLVRR